jgi:superfamily II DNA or RNA helicase
MERRLFVPRDPRLGYITNNLLLPKQCIDVDQIKGALRFSHGMDVEVDDFGTPLRLAPGTIELWEETQNHLIVPRDFLPVENRDEFDFEFVDESKQYRFEKVAIGSRIVLRDEGQDRALEVLLANQSGTLNLSCGRGKTVIGLELAARLSVPTMIIVNTTALLEQWREEIMKHLDVESVGLVQKTTMDWKRHPIVLAMVHTLSLRRDEWPMEFRRRFGLVIYDEGHHMSAPVFVKSADLFYGRRFSLTATPTRTDGLESIYQYHLGRVIHSNLEQDLIPTSYFHALAWQLTEAQYSQIQDVNKDVNLSKVRTFLGQLTWRNDIIAQDLQADLNDGRKILVLSHSTGHVQNMYRYFRNAGGGMITGDTPQEDRMAILRECNPVFGTFQLAREGLNKPSLDTLYSTTPFSNSNDLQQSVGRIQRAFADKKNPIARFYEDNAINCCVTAGRKVRKVLHKWHYPFRRIRVHVATEEADGPVEDSACDDDVE